MVRSHRDKVVGLLDVNIFELPTSGQCIYCFMYAYLGLADVLGGLPRGWKTLGEVEDTGMGAAEMRLHMRAEVEGMLRQAELKHGSISDVNMCVSPDIMVVNGVHVILCTV